MHAPFTLLRRVRGLGSCPILAARDRVIGLWSWSWSLIAWSLIALIAADRVIGVIVIGCDRVWSDLWCVAEKQTLCSDWLWSGRVNSSRSPGGLPLSESREAQTAFFCDRPCDRLWSYCDRMGCLRTAFWDVFFRPLDWPLIALIAHVIGLIADPVSTFLHVIYKHLVKNAPQWIANTFTLPRWSAWSQFLLSQDGQ